MFLNPQKYDFSRVGRLKLNTKLGRSTPLSDKILHLDDITAVIAFLLKLAGARWTWTTSTTWATAACAAWASSWRTSSASASCAWSGRSRKR